MDYSVKEIRKERMGKPLECCLKSNECFRKIEQQYHFMIEKLQEKLGTEEDNRDFLIRLDEIVSDYSNSYGEAAYTLGFHDGLNLGFEHGEYVRESRASVFNLEDMTQLVYIYDVYRSLSESLLGEEMTLGFHEGNLGALGRIYKVIGAHVSEELKRGEYPKENEILTNVSLEPEERAKRLLGK